jgi:GNAT superfamily N-acetyltransferase
MFKDMGTLGEEDYDALFEASKRYFSQAIQDGRYVAWVATNQDSIIGGGGMQINTILPRPGRDGRMLRPGPQGLIMNVFVEKDWRRKGVAERLVLRIIDFARKSGIPSVVLHASESGRPLYERLGFEETREMRFYT